MYILVREIVQNIVKISKKGLDVQSVLDEVGENASCEKVEVLIRKRLQNNELVYGFGHAILRAEDARATI